MIFYFKMITIIYTLKQEEKYLKKKILLAKLNIVWRLPWWLSVKNPPANAGDARH